jgi:hypothetical protein
MSERIAGVDGGAMYAGGVRSHRGGKRRSSLDAGMASRTLTIMTRWHESIRSCAGGAAPTHCSMGIFQVWRGGGSTAGDCCASSGLVRATYTHYHNTTVSTYRLFSCEVEYRSSVSVRSAAPPRRIKMPINPKSSPQVRDMQVRNRHCPSAKH